ncbi:MAG: hypothetical protein NTW87_06950 [Planctomycetota bacterium]|nr:hypothetical protein [Planctomycetota bacterium]
MKLRRVAGTVLELLGLAVVAVALLAGLGLTGDGRESLCKEALLLAIGAILFAVGWRMARGTSADG